MRIDHINIAAPWALLEQLRRFYCDALLLEEGPRPDFGVRGHWLYGSGKPIVHLLESDQHHRPAQQAHLDHIAFELSGVAEYLDRLNALDVQFRLNHFPDFQLCQVFCEDPCGNGIEVNFPGETPPAHS